MSEEMSQDDIDALLAKMAGGGGGGSDFSTEVAVAEDPSGAGGELSQSEIDALLAGGPTPSQPKAAAPAPKQQAAPRAQSMSFSSFGGGGGEQTRNDIAMILDVPLELTVELGRTSMYIKDILDLGPGSVVEINRLAGEPIELLVNGKVIAKGEVVVIDEKFGLRITELLNPNNENSRN